MLCMRDASEHVEGAFRYRVGEVTSLTVSDNLTHLNKYGRPGSGRVGAGAGSDSSSSLSAGFTWFGGLLQVRTWAHSAEKAAAIRSARLRDIRK